MRKSQWNKAYLGIADTGPDNTRYIQVSRNSGRKARRYWLSGVRGAEIRLWDLGLDLRRDLLAVLAVRAGGRHAHGVVAGIDIVDGAGDAGAQVREVVERGASHVGELDVAAERRGLARHPIDVAGGADHGAGQGAHRAGRDGVHPHALRAEV